MLDRRALFSRRTGLRRDAVADPWALVQIVGPPDSARALRGFQNAPEAHAVHARDAIPKFLDIVYERRIHAPIILIILEFKQLSIDETAKTHLSVRGNKELGKWIYISHPAIDKPNRF